MKIELSFRLTASNPHPDYTRYTFDNEVITLSSDPYDDGRWIWSSKLGCSQLYDTPEQAVRETCRRHGVVVLKLEELPFNSIKKLISNLEYYTGDEDASSDFIMQTQYKLADQFEKASSAEWTREELSDFIFDNDVLDFIDANDAIVADSFRDDVREIQHAIIGFFGAF